MFQTWTKWTVNYTCPPTGPKDTAWCTQSMPIYSNWRRRNLGWWKYLPSPTTSTSPKFSIIKKNTMSTRRLSLRIKYTVELQMFLFQEHLKKSWFQQTATRVWLHWSLSHWLRSLVSPLESQLYSWIKLAKYSIHRLRQKMIVTKR